MGKNQEVDPILNAKKNLLLQLSTLQLPVQRQYGELPLIKLATDGRWLAEALQYL